MALDLAAELGRIDRRQAELAQLLDRPATWQLPIDMEAELERIDRGRAELALPQAEPGIWSDRYAVRIALACCTVGALLLAGADMMTAKYLPGSAPAWGLVATGLAILILLLGRH